MSSPGDAHFTLRLKPLTEHSHFVHLLEHLSCLGTETHSGFLASFSNTNFSPPFPCVGSANAVTPVPS